MTGFMRGPSASVAMMPAAAPAMLMTPLASERNSPGMISGMRATTGPRAPCLNTLSATMSAMRAARELAAAKGRAAKRIALSGRVTRMKGILPPDPSPGLVGPYGDHGDEEEGEDIVDRHDDVADAHRFHVLLKEERHEVVVERIHEPHREEAEAYQRGAADILSEPIP